jgi:hypothetical protein
MGNCYISRISKWSGLSLVAPLPARCFCNLILVSTPPLRRVPRRRGARGGYIASSSLSLSLSLLLSPCWHLWDVSFPPLGRVGYAVLWDMTPVVWYRCTLVSEKGTEFISRSEAIPQSRYFKSSIIRIRLIRNRGRSVGIVRSRTKGHGVCCLF